MKISRKTLALTLSYLSLGSSLLFAQTPSPSASPSPTPAAAISIWRCETSGGVCEVAVRSIVSVSSHEYIVDGASRVVEVNVDTSGNMALRFYYIEPKLPSPPDGLGQSAIDKAKDLAKDIVGRTGQDDVLKRAAKNYPTTTHAHTVEYRIQSEDQIKQILTSASTALRTGGNSSIKIQ